MAAQAYYKRTLTLLGSKDEKQTSAILSRTNLATAVLSYDAAVTVAGTAPASMGSVDGIDLGPIASVQALYLEYTGTNFKLTITDANGTSTLNLNSGGTSTEKVLLLEGIAATGVGIRNTDASNTVPYFLALFGASS